MTAVYSIIGAAVHYLSVCQCHKNRSRSFEAVTVAAMPPLDLLPSCQMQSVYLTSQNCKIHQTFTKFWKLGVNLHAYISETVSCMKKVTGRGDVLGPLTGMRCSAETRLRLKAQDWRPCSEILQKKICPVWTPGL